MRCIGAFVDGELVGTAAVVRMPWPGPGSVPDPAWQLRSMAVHPDHRDRGIGAEVLAAATDLARDQGAVTLWAEARIAALGLYRRAGWSTVGEEWHKPGVGPHRWIRRDLSGPEPSGVLP
jgi:GNAT superfamily N-acetyltransferase